MPVQHTFPRASMVWFCELVPKARLMRNASSLLTGVHNKPDENEAQPPHDLGVSFDRMGRPVSLCVAWKISNPGSSSVEAQEIGLSLL